MTRDQILKFSVAAAPFADALAALANRCDLDTPARQAMFLAQVAHESGGFTRLVENLNYSRDALRRTFGKYFPDERTAAIFAHRPEKIANRVYAGRLGNGDEASGDGWRFRGRGLIQVTGRNNYHDCSFWMFGDSRLLLNPELLEQPRFACESAGWYWSANNLNRFADRNDLAGLTRAINGGLTGHADRAEKFELAQAALESAQA